MGWSGLGLPELRELCEAFGLPADGKKADLVRRIEARPIAEHVQNASGAAEAPASWSEGELETVMAEDRFLAVLEEFSVVELWRMRRVCRAFCRWATARLAQMPRVLAVIGAFNPDELVVNVLDLSTLRWSLADVGALETSGDADMSMGAMCSFDDGRVVVTICEDKWNSDDETSQTFEWRPGSGRQWVELPRLTQQRLYHAAVALADGRTMVIGGRSGSREILDSVEALAADGSTKPEELQPMAVARCGAAAARLRTGEVLVAGGSDEQSGADDGATNTAELWNPRTGAWTELPPMSNARAYPRCCVLADGRVAVTGGFGPPEVYEGEANERLRGEVFDPATRTWGELLPEGLSGDPFRHASAVAVAGGLLALGNTGVPLAPDNLFDEASGRFYKLPRGPPGGWTVHQAVAIPAAALAPHPASGQGAADKALQSA